MKKWIILGASFCLFLLIGSVVFAYQTVQSPLYEQYEKASTYAIKAGLSQITDIDYYYGTSAYYVVKGFDSENNEVIMWIRDDFSFDHLERSADGITEEKVLEIIQREEDVVDILSIRLGFERGMPVYEVTYTTEDDRQGYYYLTFSDGTFMKKYQLRTN